MQQQATRQSTVHNLRQALEKLPVSGFLSSASWQGLIEYVEGAPHSPRAHRVIEYFKALDWMELEEITPNLLDRLPGSLASRVKKDITTYLADKNASRFAEKTKRDDYRLRVFAHYKEVMTSEDKILLEALRDEELEQTGRDANWHHYFWFTSFKQINAFCRMTLPERDAMIEAFRRDITQYLKNKSRMENGTYGDYYWGETESYQAGPNHQHRQQNNQQQYQESHQKSGFSSYNTAPKVAQAFELLHLSPGTPFKQVKQQFRRLTLSVHPDKPGGSNSKMMALLEAYQLICKTLNTT